VTSPPASDRRRYPRARVDIAVRPLGPLARALPRRVTDLSLGGLRAYADERFQVGERVELELLFATGDPATLIAEVVWVEDLPAGAPARHDVGMHFVEVGSHDLARITAVLEHEPGAARPAPGQN
jgi:Tfp pilus assembly protein PilZ